MILLCFYVLSYTFICFYYAFICFYLLQHDSLEQQEEMLYLCLTGFYLRKPVKTQGLGRHLPPTCTQECLKISCVFLLLSVHPQLEGSDPNAMRRVINALLGVNSASKQTLVLFSPGPHPCNARGG